MPIHDWTRVDAGIFHAFHHGWIEEMARALNRGCCLPTTTHSGNSIRPTLVQT